VDVVVFEHSVEIKMHHVQGSATPEVRTVKCFSVKTIQLFFVKFQLYRCMGLTMAPKLHHVRYGIHMCV